ncbi:thioesterase superfamily protein [Micromonospora sagamiensis]|uniref:Thioesterase superfamily protein n=1 Tax=Micromonospora sagamiensis TaxID=47875 RepID=A0A562WGP5_9ACTN|nr:thioesterase family protein [Micromonospora sagamiensis]TWJ29436.1 thioesterase superfamily protein [Micromonospora sagamiensis]
MSGSEAFYRPDGADTYLPTAHTEGPWDPRYQHGGPPGALLARAVEECLTGTDLVVARITVEILGPVPCQPVQVRARVERPGRRVQLVRAELRHEGRLLMAASAWAVRPAPEALPVGPATASGPAPGPETGRPMVPPPARRGTAAFSPPPSGASSTVATTAPVRARPGSGPGIRFCRTSRCHRCSGRC